MTTADTTPDARPTLAEAFPEGDSLRLVADPLARGAYVLGLLVSATSLVLLVAYPGIPVRYLVLHGLSGVASGVASARLLLREDRVSTDGLETGDLFRGRRADWADVARIRLINPGTADSPIVPVSIVFALVLMDVQGDEMASYLPPDADWMRTVIAVAFALGLIATVRYAWGRRNRRKERGGLGNVCALRAADGRLLATIPSWVSLQAQPTVERVARHCGIPVEHVEPGHPL